MRLPRFARVGPSQGPQALGSGRGDEALRAGKRLALRVSLAMLPALALLSPLIAVLLYSANCVRYPAFPSAVSPLGASVSA